MKVAYSILLIRVSYQNGNPFSPVGPWIEVQHAQMETIAYSSMECFLYPMANTCQAHRKSELPTL